MPQPDHSTPIRQAGRVRSSLPLPPLARDREGPVLAAFAQRRTIRAILPTPLPMHLLSSLLWCAYGVNREQGPFGAPGRTAASASNSQEIDLYVALSDGAYRYEAADHSLAPVSHRRPADAGADPPHQSGVTASAPVQLIFVANLHSLTHTRGFDEPGLHDPEVQKAYYFVEPG